MSSLAFDLFSPIKLAVNLNDHNITESVWVGGTTGNLYLGDWGGRQINWQCYVADNAKGDIRIEGQNMFSNGMVRKMSFRSNN